MYFNFTCQTELYSFAIDTMSLLVLTLPILNHIDLCILRSSNPIPFKWKWKWGPFSTQFQFPPQTILKFMLSYIRLFLDQFLLLTSFDLVTKSEYCSFSMHEPCPFSIDFWASFRSFQMTSDNCTKHVWNDMFFQDHGPPLNFYCIFC